MRHAGACYCRVKSTVALSCAPQQKMQAVRAAREQRARRIAGRRGTCSCPDGECRVWRWLRASMVASTGCCRAVHPRSRAGAPHSCTSTGTGNAAGEPGSAARLLDAVSTVSLEPATAARVASAVGAACRPPLAGREQRWHLVRQAQAGTRILRGSLFRAARSSYRSPCSSGLPSAKTRSGSAGAHQRVARERSARCAAGDDFAKPTPW